MGANRYLHHVKFYIMFYAFSKVRRCKTNSQNNEAADHSIDTKTGVLLEACLV